jgi:2-keto-4-pentenoate hydratase
MGDKAEAAAQFFLGLRASDAVPADDLPAALRPENDAELIAIYVATMRMLGPIGGWKVGAPTPAATPWGSPLPAAGIHPSPSVVPSRFRAVESEIGFHFGRALPPRAEAYDATEIAAAIETCHATIEVVEPRYRDYRAVDPTAIRSDLGMHGALVVGAPIGAWTREMFGTLAVTLTVNGAVRRQAVGSNPGGPDLMRTLVWLANSEVVKAFGGLQAGTVVTTGSWTGVEIVPPGGEAVAQFDGFAPVAVGFPD